jgi:hypothetical protein
MLIMTLLKLWGEGEKREQRKSKREREREREREEMFTPQAFRWH